MACANLQFGHPMDILFDLIQTIYYSSHVKRKEKQATNDNLQFVSSIYTYECLLENDASETIATAVYGISKSIKNHLVWLLFFYLIIHK